jgi:hypothetical protein
MPNDDAESTPDEGGRPAVNPSANGPAQRDSKGRTRDHPDFNPYDTVEANAKHAARREAADEVEARLKRWAVRRYPVAVLAGAPEQWKRNLAHAIARRDAEANPETASPTLMFSGDQAVSAGAADDDLATLRALPLGDIAALRLRAAAMRRDRRRQIETLARKIATDRDTAVVAPEPFNLAELLAEPDEGAAYRIAEAWPAGGRVLLAAQYKSGKTTMVGDVIQSLVGGGQFLGRFDVTPVDRVALIDTELDRRTLRRWLRDKGIRKVEAVSVLSLRGAVSTFDILDAATRTEWAQRLAGADVVILDCLRPVLDALGLSEDKDAGRVLVAFDALLAEIGANEGLVVTHMGHQNERARGDSRLLDWPDALWKIVRDGDDTDDDGTRRRYFSALGRDVALPEGLLTFDAATRHLTYGSGNRKGIAALVAMPELLAMVRAQPGALSKRAAETRLCEEHGLTQQDARATISKAVRDGALTVSVGARRAHILSPGTIDPFARPDDVSADSEGR